jgi:hypothetical protein
MQSDEEDVSVPEAMLKNYDHKALVKDLEHRTLKEKRGVKVLCAKSREWVYGMTKTVDTSLGNPGGDRLGERKGFGRVFPVGLGGELSEGH